MSPHVHALLQKGVRVRRLLSIRVYWQTFQLSRGIKTVVQLKKLMQHWTEVALGSAWPSHGLTTSGINCQPMARLSNFSPGRRTVRHSSQVGKIKPTPLTSKGWISIKKYWENYSDISRITRQTLNSSERPLVRMLKLFALCQNCVKMCCKALFMNHRGLGLGGAWLTWTKKC